MDIEFLLLLIMVLVTTLLAYRLHFHSSQGESEKDVVAVKNAFVDQYQHPGYLRRVLLMYSISTSPLLVSLVLLMSVFSSGFILADALDISIALTTVLAILVIAILLYAIKELALYKTRAFENKLIEAVEIIQAASMSGASPQSALAAVPESMTGDVAKEFRSIVRALKLGASIESATNRVSALYDTETTRMLIQALIMKWNIGGSLSELMKSLADILRERQSVRMQIRGKLSGAKYASIFMGLAPYLLIPYFINTQPAWIDIFLTHPSGLNVLAIAFGLQITGLIWLRRVLRINL